MNKDEEELVKVLGREYLYYCGEKSHSSYILNEDKLIKFSNIIKYCEELVSTNNAKIELCIQEPKNETGVVSMRFYDDFILQDEGNSLKEFVNILQLCDAVNINGTGVEDGSFIIDFFVDNLYEQKKNN